MPTRVSGVFSELASAVEKRVSPLRGCAASVEMTEYGVGWVEMTDCCGLMPKPAAARSAAPCSRESSDLSLDLRGAESRPAMRPCTSVGGTEKVGGHSEASRTPRRPLVPAPM